ncbi:hypothetical protein VMCG_01396 [Cytospora schulzeri]|uniref:Uncharacterized protein n=1 Tax=Cytospora schulzeri TaxID=448051 RepID=A0A423X6A2_9PEZI|nr:hypothetical protein VMCG_01396 [Valsa malicola]
MAGFEPTDSTVVGFGTLSLILIFTDIYLQFEFLEAIDEVDPRPRRFRVGSSMSLTVAYLLACLPFATSLYACLWFLVCGNFVFNVGCFMEMRFELFRRTVDVFVDGHGISISWEVPDEVQVAVMAGIIGGSLLVQEAII